MNETQLLFYGDDKPAEELYDLEADPHEIQNLAKDPKFASELARHRKLLTDWIAKTGDQGQQTEDEGGLIQVYYDWGDRCVNPEYDAVKQLAIERSQRMPLNQNQNLHHGFSPMIMTQRRRFFQQAGSSVLGLPLLDSLASQAGESTQTAPKRVVCIGLDLSLRPETFFPDGSQSKSKLTPLLQPLQHWRGKLTAFSKMEHPGVSGGHSAVHAFLSGVRREQRDAFAEGCVSLEQVVALEKGHLTRFPFLTFGVGGGDSIAWSASGNNLPKLENPTEAYEMLFTPKSAKEKSAARELSIMDRQVAALLDHEAKRVRSSLDSWDREKLEEYVQSVDQFETKLRAQEKWIDAPIPKSDGPPPRWAPDGCIDKVRATLDVMAMALMSDSTRIMTMNIGVGLPVAKRIPGVDRSYHDLSHSGQDPNKLAQLHKVEFALMKELDAFLHRLASQKDVNGARLLDNTIVLLGSGMGNASSHSNLDLPVIVAGGGLRHAPEFFFQHKTEDQTPLCNLYVTLLQQLGLERDQFGTSTGNLNELLVV